MILTREETIAWNDTDPDTRRRVRMALHDRCIWITDADPKETTGIYDADGNELGSVYRPDYLNG